MGRMGRMRRRVDRRRPGAPCHGSVPIAMESSLPVTKLLRDAAEGNGTAAAELLTLVYEELRRYATALYRDQRAGGTLQPTALVHEAFLKLVDQDIDWSSRAQFYAVATKAMRSILVDRARARHRVKRGGGWQRVTVELVDETPIAEGGVPVEAIDQALEELAALDPRKAQLVELRFFGGLTGEQAADVLGIARSTSAEEWRTARAWLHRRLEQERS